MKDNNIILIITNNSGGLYLFRRHLIAEIIKKGYKVIALTPFTSRINELQQMGVKLIETTIDRRGTNPINDLMLLKVYWQHIKNIRPEYILTYTIKPNIYGGIVACLLNTKYAANITGLGTAFQNNNWLKTITTVLYKIALRKANVVFFENKSNAEIFISNKIISPNKVKVLQGAGVDLNHFIYLPYPVEDLCTEFLFVGRIMKEKGVDELFSVIKKLVTEGYKCHLTIVGTLEENYRRLIDEYTKEGWLSFAGYTKDVRKYIKNCHCSVLPSWHEGMSNTNLECAACGRPLITTRIPGCEEAVIDGITGLLCEPKNKNSLYDSMKQFLELPLTDKQNMGIKGREYMNACFDKNSVVNETMAALEFRM